MNEPARRQGPMPQERWPEPFQEMQNLWDRMSQVFDPGWAVTRLGGGPMAAAAGPWQPAVDVEETDDAFVYELDVPGVDRDDLTVEVRDNDLVISGKYQDKERSGVMHRRSRRTGSFSYRSTLPSGVDQDSMKAELDNGVLSVTVRKAEKSQPRRIEVK